MKRSRAIFCMAKNESVFLPIWNAYYRQFFDPSDIFILDHGSTDGSAARLGEAGLAQVIPIDYPFFNDFAWYTKTISHTQIRLFELYETVVFAEPDEILVHREGLGAYLDSFNKSGVCTTGYELQHRPEIEPPIDLSKPILSQRWFWHRHVGFDKPLIGRRPIAWNCPGFHTAANVTERDPDLLLIHLHKMDYDTTLAKNRRNRSYTWDETSLEGKRGTQSLLLDQEFDRWFHESSRYGNEIQEIPADLRRCPPV